MKTKFYLFFPLLFLVGVHAAGAGFAVPGQTPADLPSALKQLAAFEYGASRAPVVALTEYGFHPQGTEAGRKELESGLIRLLQGEATRAGKEQACRLLSLFGGSGSVPVLLEKLSDPELAEMARYTLARIPGSEVNAALRQASGRSSGRRKADILRTLGGRKDPEAVPMLLPLLADPDRETAVAAAAALGGIATPEALAALTAARSRTQGDLKKAVSEACLRGGEERLARGEKKAAAEIFLSLLDGSEAPPLQAAALKGLARAAGPDSLDRLREALRGKDRLVQAAAIRLVAEFPGERFTLLLADEMPNLSPAAQVRVLAALADRADRKAATAALAAARSADPAVRAAAYSALARLGDSSCVLLLARAAAQSKDAEQAAAREALYRLTGADIDGTILRQMEEAEAAVQLEMIRAVGQRGIRSAADALLRMARRADGAVRRESVRALRETAGAEHVPALLEILPLLGDASDREEAAHALALVLKRSDPPPLGQVQKAYEAAGSSAVRIALLQALGEAWNRDGLPLLRNALKDNDAEIRRAAILALTLWPNDAPAADLLAVASGPSAESHTVLALRGYIRLVTLLSVRPEAQTVKMLQSAMRLARQPEEKKTILGNLPNYPCPEALALAKASTGDPAVATEARIAEERIRGLLVR